MEYIHGGVFQSYSIKLDFSVSINPLGCPERVRDAICKSSINAERYPDPCSESLCRQIAQKMEIQREHVLAGNGASELIMAAVHAIRPENVIVPIPSFFGYERAATSTGAVLNYYETGESGAFMPDKGLNKLINRRNGMIFLTNPGNPSGSYISRENLKSILEAAGENGLVVVCDECFMELSDDGDNRSLISEYPDYSNLLILRAFTKTYAMPGIRLGYMIGSNEKIMGDIRNNLPEWNVSFSAQMAGSAALEENGYIERARSLIKAERKYLESELKNAGCRTVHSDTCYILFYCEVKDLYERLAKRGILIRNCSNFRGLGEGYYRTSVRRHEDNAILISEIKRIIDEEN